MNVAGLILAGSADFKNDLALSDMFDQRLQAKVLKIVDVSYGGDNGFNQAIELAGETYANWWLHAAPFAVGYSLLLTPMDTQALQDVLPDYSMVFDLGVEEPSLGFRVVA